MHGSATGISAAPPASHILRQLLRGALIWMLVRISITAVTFGAVVLLAPPQSIIVLVATGALAYIDARVMHEVVFYANLGIPAWIAPACAVAAALVLEIAVGVLT